ncbi:hypothetical protein COCNU_scaffold011549G000020 [Cocos nucifera]|nr:hypothetical protein [Cocos nucifera]
MVSFKDDTLAARDKALLTYQRDLDYCKSATSRAIEEYKSSKGFIEEVMEASGEAFNSGFSSCKCLIGKFFLDPDLSGITQEAGLTLALEIEAQPAPEIGSVVVVPHPISEVPTILITSKVEPSAPTEVPVADFTIVPPLSSMPAKVLTSVEVISLEDDAAVAPAKDPQVDA